MPSHCYFPSATARMELMGTGAANLDHEVETMCGGLQSKNKEGGWTSASFTEKSYPTNLHLYVKEK